MTVSDDRKPSMVHLVPTTKSRPIRYVEGIERAGMIIDLKHSLAMYVSKSVPAVGPQGPPGEIPDILDTIIASASNENTPLTVGGPKTTFRAPYPLNMTNGYVRISLTAAPVGSALVVDITMNGTTIFSTQVRCDENERTSVTSAVPAVLNIPGNLVPDDAEFLVYITAVGSTFAGTGLKVALTGQKVVP